MALLDLNEKLQLIEDIKQRDMQSLKMLKDTLKNHQLFKLNLLKQLDNLTLEIREVENSINNIHKEMLEQSESINTHANLFLSEQVNHMYEINRELSGRIFELETISNFQEVDHN